MGQPTGDPDNLDPLSYLRNRGLFWQDNTMRLGAFDLIDPLPELKDPHVIALLRPWIDVGSVGTIALTKLERYFGAKELGRLTRPGNFYDFTRLPPYYAYRQGQKGP